MKLQANVAVRIATMLQLITFREFTSEMRAMPILTCLCICQVLGTSQRSQDSAELDTKDAPAGNCCCHMRQATSLGWSRSFAGSKPAARALAAAASAARETGENAAGDRRPSASRKLCLHDCQGPSMSSQNPSRADLSMSGQKCCAGRFQLAPFCSIFASSI